MSFVNLLANDIWTEQDIVNRTEAILRSQYSQQAENIINRKVSGMQMGQYTLTPAEQADVAGFAAASFQARADGDAARADMVKLLAVIAYENALKTLASIPDDADSLAVVAGATADTLSLYALRNPVPETPVTQ